MAALARFKAKKPLYAFDFDGTLTPIRDRPEAVVLPPATADGLKKLAAMAPVCVISGRSRDDVSTRLPPGLFAIVGNHGVEGGGDEPLDVEGVTKVTRSWIAQLREPVLSLPGVWLEDKFLSLTIHTRANPSPDETERLILACGDRLLPRPRFVLGKRVINVVPPGLPHKGTALENLMRRAGRTSALFIGDDLNDEDVFELENPEVFKIRVGMLAGSKAEYHLDSQEQMTDLLRLLTEP